MRTDTIFYQLFLNFPTLIFEILGQPPSLANDYEFTSREIKELAKRIDGLYLPKEAVFSKPLYFVEVQFKRKEYFYWRLFAEISAYLEQYQPINDWLAVCLFASHSCDLEIPAHYRGFLMSQQVKIIYLDELEIPSDSLGLRMVELVVSDEEVVRAKTDQLLARARDLGDFSMRSRVIELIENVLVYKFINLSREEIQAMFAISDLKQSKIYQEAKLEGKVEGKAEGLREGELKAKLESVPPLLALGLSTRQIAKALNLDIEMVKQALPKAKQK